MINKNLAFSLVLSSSIALSGCAANNMQAEFIASVPKNMPESYTISSSANAQKLNEAWWTYFNVPELNKLEEIALKDSFTIQIAIERLKQSAANYKGSQASLFPTVSLNSSYSDSRRASDDGSRANISDAESYTFGLSAAYEIDLWGRLSTQNQSSLLNYNASQEDLQASAMSLTASVAEAWLNILQTRAEIDIVKNQIKVDQSFLELTRVRFQNGLTTGLDVLQQEQSSEATASELPVLETKEKIQVNSLAILLGRMPGDMDDITLEHNLLLTVIPELPALGIPADLLSDRPDIRSAALKVQAADKDLVVAKLAWLPSLRLSASGSFSSGVLDLLFGNWVRTLTATITETLFDGGKRQADKERVRAVASERLITYTQTVANALQEVESALMNENTQTNYLKSLQLQLKLAKLAEDDAFTRYLNGKDTFLRYLTQHQSVQKLERTVIREQANLIKYRIALYRTLGGQDLNLV